MVVCITTAKTIKYELREHTLKYLLRSIAKVGYHIPVPDFYVVLHSIRCRKITLID